MTIFSHGILKVWARNNFFWFSRRVLVSHYWHLRERQGHLWEKNSCRIGNNRIMGWDGKRIFIHPGLMLVLILCQLVQSDKEKQVAFCISENNSHIKIILNYSGIWFSLKTLANSYCYAIIHSYSYTVQQFKFFKCYGRCKCT